MITVAITPNPHITALAMESQLKYLQHRETMVTIKQKRQHALIVLMENMHHQKVQAHVQHVLQHVMEIV